ncbi:ctr copper transporter family protein [Hirsutella rhossiliensis]|uniref:Copper transport protein n=1 Tax=Hirsutella rhossiliensis TaxID=111463 RepID=A0A9P8MZK4_9HYPO|nr:ctr copper transporter family domain-containing protein [Hirsutella rhossiliensis]KAH0964134.1 ctr copper transporter family domain-containing protein [Hirsutella rhossiliensis]
MSFLFPRHGADHSDMDMGSAPVVAAAATDAHGHDSMGSMMMTMVFQTNMETALYSNSWTPRSPGAYAATCLFLIALAVIGRLLLAAKSLQEARWLDRDTNRRYIASNGRMQLAEYITRDPDAKQMTLSENGIEESVVVVGRKGTIARPWRLSVDPVRAVMDTILAGVGYLLMLAVMTMNVGYFLSVLAGVFVGSLAVGRYSATSADH